MSTDHIMGQLFHFPLFHSTYLPRNYQNSPVSFTSQVLLPRILLPMCPLSNLLPFFRARFRPHFLWEAFPMCKGSQGLEGFLTALGWYGWRLDPYFPTVP